MKYLTLIIFLIIYSCGKKNLESSINGFDISPNSQEVVYSYKIDSLYNVFTKNINTGKTKLVCKGAGNYINPKYFDNGKIIISIFYPNNNLSPEFHFYDTNSHKVVRQIKINNGYISDFTFSLDNKIYYLQATTFDSYSPIVSKSYHDFDIYELNLDSLESKKLSNLNSYFMGEVLNWKKDSLLVSIQGEPNESGLFFFNTNAEMKDLKPLSRIVIKNDTLRNSTMYANPVILSNNDLLCASSYQMVKLDLKAKKEYPILPSTGYHYTIIRRKGNMIFYQQSDNTNNIYYYNLSNKKINVMNVDPIINE